ncbi:MAG TPA: preprotein translocase subunit YajC [Tepidisphaeraceae bacterium]|nr:preprotein translocase subunit YajC [Tepidisphaeraceae bacterium]
MIDLNSNWIDGFGQLMAQAAPPSTAPRPPEWFDFLRSPMFMILLLFAVLWFFMIGGKRKEERKRQDMLARLKKGDEVVTIGGEIGRVLETRNDRVQLKLDENTNTKVWYLRSAIHRVIEEAESKQ